MYPKPMHLSNPTRHLQGEAIFAVLGVIILSFAAYLDTLFNTFVFDDVCVISGNYFIRDLKNFWGLFTSKYFAASGELSYRPVVTLSYFVDYSLWHLNPLGYHLTNIVLHTLNSALLFFLVQRMVRNTPTAFLAPPLSCMSSCQLPINLCTEPRCFTPFSMTVFVILSGAKNLIFTFILFPSCHISLRFFQRKWPLPCLYSYFSSTT